MPEIVSCPDCHRELRVPEELVGKRVKCPACGLTFVATPGPAVPPQVLPADEGAGPAAQPEVGGPPLPQAGPTVGHGGYGAPGPLRGGDADWDRRPEDRQRAKSALMAPGICLLITGILGVLGSLYLTVDFMIIDPEVVMQNAPPVNDPQQRELQRKVVDFVHGPGGLAINLLALAVSLFVCLAGALMLAGKARGLAVTGSALAMIQVWPCCCLLGFPFGLWSLIVLYRPDVREAFR